MSFSFNMNKSATLKMDNCKFNEELINEMCGNIQQPNYMLMKIPTYIQCKTHKNKRINKKWLKKYGYRMVMKTVNVKVIEVSSQNFPNGIVTDSIHLIDSDFLNKIQKESNNG